MHELVAQLAALRGVGVDSARHWRVQPLTTPDLVIPPINFNASRAAAQHGNGPPAFASTGMASPSSSSSAGAAAAAAAAATAAAATALKHGVGPPNAINTNLNNNNDSNHDTNPASPAAVTMPNTALLTVPSSPLSPGPGMVTLGAVAATTGETPPVSPAGTEGALGIAVATTITTTTMEAPPPTVSATGIVIAPVFSPLSHPHAHAPAPSTTLHTINTTNTIITLPTLVTPVAGVGSTISQPALGTPRSQHGIVNNGITTPRQSNGEGKGMLLNVVEDQSTTQLGVVGDDKQIENTKRSIISQPPVVMEGEEAEESIPEPPLTGTRPQVPVVGTNIVPVAVAPFAQASLLSAPGGMMGVTGSTITVAATTVMAPAPSVATGSNVPAAAASVTIAPPSPALVPMQSLRGGRLMNNIQQRDSNRKNSTSGGNTTTQGSHRPSTFSHVDAATTNSKEKEKESAAAAAAAAAAAPQVTVEQGIAWILDKINEERIRSALELKQKKREQQAATQKNPLTTITNVSSSMGTRTTATSPRQQMPAAVSPPQQQQQLAAAAAAQHQQSLYTQPPRTFVIGQPALQSSAKTGRLPTLPEQKGSDIADEYPSDKRHYHLQLPSGASNPALNGPPAPSRIITVPPPVKRVQPTLPIINPIASPLSLQHAQLLLQQQQQQLLLIQQRDAATASGATSPPRNVGGGSGPPLAHSSSRSNLPQLHIHTSAEGTHTQSNDDIVITTGIPTTMMTRQASNGWIRGGGHGGVNGPPALTPSSTLNGAGSPVAAAAAAVASAAAAPTNTGMTPAIHPLAAGTHARRPSGGGISATSPPRMMTGGSSSNIGGGAGGTPVPLSMPTISPQNIPRPLYTGSPNSSPILIGGQSGGAPSPLPGSATDSPHAGAQPLPVNYHHNNGPGGGRSGVTAFKYAVAPEFGITTAPSASGSGRHGYVAAAAAAAVAHATQRDAYHNPWHQHYQHGTGRSSGEYKQQYHGGSSGGGGGTRVRAPAPGDVYTIGARSFYQPPALPSDARPVVGRIPSNGRTSSDRRTSPHDRMMASAAVSIQMSAAPTPGGQRFAYYP
jgi:hypothetical protein